MRAGREALDKLADAGFWGLEHVVNPMVEVVLRSPLHPPLSGSLARLTYVGRRSGDDRSLPVMFAEADEHTLVLVPASPERKRWWRNFADGPLAVTVTVRGEDRMGTAMVVHDADRAEDLLEAYIERFPRASGWLGHTDAEGHTVAEPGVVVVEVDLDVPMDQAAGAVDAPADVDDAAGAEGEPPPWAVDPVHAPGKHHRGPAPDEAAPRTPSVGGGHDQPWVRTSHSDSQVRRGRSGR